MFYSHLTILKTHTHTHTHTIKHTGSVQFNFLYLSWRLFYTHEVFPSPANDVIVSTTLSFCNKPAAATVHWSCWTQPINSTGGVISYHTECTKVLAFYLNVQPLLTNLSSGHRCGFTGLSVSQFLPIAVICERVVAGEGQEHPKPGPQREEYLSGSIHPHLEKTERRHRASYGMF